MGISPRVPRCARARARTQHRQAWSAKRSRTPPGRPLRTRGGAISAAHWPRARPAPVSRPSQHPGLPTASGEVPSRREPGAGSAWAGRRAEVSAAAAGPAVVGCARAGRALVGCGPRGWAAGSGLGSGLGRRPGLRCARLRAAAGRRLAAKAGRARPRAGLKGARRAAERGEARAGRAGRGGRRRRGEETGPWTRGARRPRRCAAGTEPKMSA